MLVVIHHGDQDYRRARGRNGTADTKARFKYVMSPTQR